MRRVLIIAPSFAPASNPPTQRVRFFARHLPANGWIPTVLSVDPRYYEEPADPDIGRLIPSELEVVRTPALPAKWTRPIGVGDLGMRAYFPMRQRLGELLQARRFDLLLIPGPPWHTFRLGPWARRRFGVPYVLDYIDPWVFSMGGNERAWWTKGYWFRRMALMLEPRAAREASHIVAVSDGTNEGVRRSYPDLPPDMFTGIPYGFEPSDLDALRARPRANPYWDGTDGKRHLVYVGAMLPNGYETLRALFRALAVIRERHPVFYERTRLHFFGTTYDPKAPTKLVEPVARELGVGDIVDERPARVPYLDALNILTQADGVLALGSSERHYTASKIFPNIFSRRPVFAVYHEASSVCDVMREAQAGVLVTYGDVLRAESRVAEIADALERLVAPETYDPARVHWDAFAEYSAAHMTRRLTRQLDGVVERGGARGGVPE
jgi:glycosyltransferase involved in cell wall biosynthesis